MKILIVDDEYSKAQEIAAALANTQIEGLVIDQRTTAHSARCALQATVYDVLIIDLHLPPAMGERPNEEGGIELFDLINLDAKIDPPLDVLFITGREELLEPTSKKVVERGAVLCLYRFDAEAWKEVLIGRVKRAARRLRRCPRIDVDIAVMTALRTPELDAVLSLPYNWEIKRFEGDPLTYHFGSIAIEKGGLSIVAACANRKGMPSSAAVATKLALLFRPKYLVMIGICAGVRSKCSFGDVVVGDPVWDWGSGKRGIDVDGSPVFQAAPHQMPLNNGLSQLASDLANDESVLRSIRAGWSSSTPEGLLRVHVAPMASGASVIADDCTARTIAIQHRELVAIEMEAYAVMAAAEYAADPKPTAVVIKSVCDHADSVKNDHWQSYASYTSAAFADQLFRKLNVNSNH